MQNRRERPTRGEGGARPAFYDACAALQLGTSRLACVGSIHSDTAVYVGYWLGTSKLVPAVRRRSPLTGPLRTRRRVGDVRAWSSAAPGASTAASAGARQHAAHRPCRGCTMPEPGDVGRRWPRAKSAQVEVVHLLLDLWSPSLDLARRYVAGGVRPPGPTG